MGSGGVVVSGAMSELGAAHLHRFKQYPAYKKSGIEWLRETPAHWTVTVLKRIGNLRAGAGFPEDEQGLQSGGIPFFKVGDMGFGGNEREMISCPNTISDATARRLRAFVFPARTIVFAKVGAALLLNRRRILTQPSCIDNNMMGFMPGIRDHVWAFYWLSGLDFRRLANPGAVPSVNEGQLQDTPVVLPPAAEQRAIAVFLDRETERINALVTKKERLIELLQEERIALITRAVTRGVDPNVVIKDSGVEWLGEIPAHWEVRELRRLNRKRTSITYGIVQAGPDVEDGIPYIRTSDMAGDVLPRGGYLRTSREIDAQYQRSKVSAGDVVVAIRATVGKALQVPTYLDGANLTQGTAKVAPGEMVEGRFLLAALQSRSSRQHFEALAKGATFREITLDMLRRFPIPVPPLSEQRTIVAFLEAEGARIDLLVDRVREAINRLKELRTALISAAVTGKIDVRDAT